MHWKIADLPTRLQLLSALILLIGLVSATWIYLRADTTPYGALGYVEEGGTLYPVMPEDSKEYLRSMELYGGTANVLVDQFRRWFGSLWHGKSLAKIIACLSIIISFALFYAANHLLPRQEGEIREDHPPDETS